VVRKRLSDDIQQMYYLLYVFVIYVEVETEARGCYIFSITSHNYYKVEDVTLL
jgi:hypothetical protein